MKSEIIRLRPVVKDYAWGNNIFIPSLLGEKATGQPQAELWMGAHKQGSCLIAETGESLRDFLDRNPYFAGCRADSFPFLFKVLAIEKPLSIQVHPDAEQAKRCFEEGNPNYSDPNPKAEMFYALTDCTLMCGLRKQYTKNEETLAMKEYLERFYPGDPETSAPFRLNIVHLEAGEAVYLKPGILHAYIRGNGIELMNNSDNVIRAGLTSKHIDRNELDRIALKTPYDPALLGSFEDTGGEHFFTEAGFILTVMKDGFFTYDTDTVKILICTEGSATLNGYFRLSKGEVCIIAKGHTLCVETDGTVFCAE